MNLTNEDKQLLAELCEQSSVSKEKVLRLLETIQEYEFKDRRTGIYDELREILKTTFEPRKHAI
jgi:DNA-binding IclR family transcriptional regulator